MHVVQHALCKVDISAEVLQYDVQPGKVVFSARQAPFVAGLSAHFLDRLLDQAQRLWIEQDIEMIAVDFSKPNISAASHQPLCHDPIVDTQHERRLPLGRHDIGPGMQYRQPIGFFDWRAAGSYVLQNPVKRQHEPHRLRCLTAAIGRADRRRAD